MLERIEAEIKLLRRRYVDVEYSCSGNHVVIRGLALPFGWNCELTDVLVLIPPGYPATPPDNFFVPSGLRLCNGEVPTNYSEAANINDRQWGQFSFHSQEWNPASNPEEGDNLVTYGILIERRLSEVN
jgi:hypothetical protein